MTIVVRRIGQLSGGDCEGPDSAGSVSAKWSAAFGPNRIRWCGYKTTP